MPSRTCSQMTPADDGVHRCICIDVSEFRPSFPARGPCLCGRSALLPPLAAVPHTRRTTVERSRGDPSRASACAACQGSCLLHTPHLRNKEGVFRDQLVQLLGAAHGNHIVTSMCTRQQGDQKGRSQEAPHSRTGCSLLAGGFETRWKGSYGRCGTAEQRSSAGCGPGGREGAPAVWLLSTLATHWRSATIGYARHFVEAIRAIRVVPAHKKAGRRPTSHHL